MHQLVIVCMRWACLRRIVPFCSTGPNEGWSWYEMKLTDCIMCPRFCHSLPEQLRMCVRVSLFFICNGKMTDKHLAYNANGMRFRGLLFLRSPFEIMPVEEDSCIHYIELLGFSSANVFVPFSVFASFFFCSLSVDVCSAFDVNSYSFRNVYIYLRVCMQKCVVHYARLEWALRNYYSCFIPSELLSRPISTGNADCKKKILYFSTSCLINESFWLENTPMRYYVRALIIMLSAFWYSH